MFVDIGCAENLVSISLSAMLPLNHTESGYLGWKMLLRVRGNLRTPVPFPLAVHVSYQEVYNFMPTSALTNYNRNWGSQCFSHLFGPCGVAIDLLQRRLVDEADLVRRDPHDWTILVMEVQDVLVPMTRCILLSSPKLGYPSEKGAWNLSKGVETSIVDDVGDDCNSYQKQCLLPAKIR